MHNAGNKYNKSVEGKKAIPYLLRFFYKKRDEKEFYRTLLVSDKIPLSPELMEDLIKEITPLSRGGLREKEKVYNRMLKNINELAGKNGN